MRETQTVHMLCSREVRSVGLSPSLDQRPCRLRPAQCRRSHTSDGHQMSALPSWYQESKGIDASKLEMANFEGLRGMQANSAIPAGEPIAKVALDSTLLVEPFKRSPFPDFCPQDQWKRSPWFLKMALMLLHERDQLRSRSRLKHYIEDLESITIDTPVAWPDANLEELHYPYLQQQVQKQKASWNELYESAASASSRRIQRQDLLWAMQAVRSRAFSGPYSGTRLRTLAQLLSVLLAVGSWFLFVAHTPIEKVLNAGIAAVLFNIMYDALLSKKLKWFAMIPVIDYCNHSPDIQSDISFEVFRERFSATLSAPVEKGQQVYISYGQHKNDYLMQYFGFGIKGLSSDVYTIEVGDALEAFGADAPKSLELTSRGLHSDGLQWLQGLQNKKEAYERIAAICYREQQQWPTTVGEDQKQLKSGELDSRSTVAVRFRIGKKRLLSASIDSLRKKAGHGASKQSNDRGFAKLH